MESERRQRKKQDRGHGHTTAAATVAVRQEEIVGVQCRPGSVSFPKLLYKAGKRPQPHVLEQCPQRGGPQQSSAGNPCSSLLVGPTASSRAQGVCSFTKEVSAAAGVAGVDEVLAGSSLIEEV